MLVRHPPIAGDLGDDRGTGDGHRLPVAADDRRLRKRQAGSGKASSTSVRALAELPDGSEPRLPGRLRDPNAVNGLTETNPHRLRSRAPRCTGELLADGGEELLAVVDSFNQRNLPVARSGGRMTAPAATGPASGPLPTSSTPATSALSCPTGRSPRRMEVRALNAEMLGRLRRCQ